MRRSRYLLKRSIGYLATIFLILLFNFVLIRVMPGDPMLYILGEEAYYYDFYYNNPEYLEQLCQEYDLGRSPTPRSVPGFTGGIFCISTLAPVTTTGGQSWI